jgi:hypothetical protein
LVKVLVVIGPACHISASSRQALAATIAAGRKNLAAALRGQARTETVTALAYKLGGLVGTLCSHLFKYRGVRPFLDERVFLGNAHNSFRLKTIEPGLSNVAGL